MRGKVWVVAAVGALLASATLAGSLAAQEKVDEAPRMRVMSVTRGSYLGVYISDVSAEDVERLGLRAERGVLIEDVADDGPAADAGLAEDDVLLSWNGERIESAAQLRRMLRETPAGRNVELGVFRDGSERSIDVELGEGGAFARSFNFGGDFQWDEEHAADLRKRLEDVGDQMKDLQIHVRPQVMSFMSMRGGRLGVAIQSLGPQLGEYFGLGERTGVLITTVKGDSPAAKAGLRAGDVIVAVEGEEIEGPGDVTRLVWGAEAGPVDLRILRDRSERTVTVELPEAEGTWRSDDGETHGFMFGPEAMDLGDVHVEWSEPSEVPGQWLMIRPDSRILEFPGSGGPVLLRPGRHVMSI